MDQHLKFRLLKCSDSIHNKPANLYSIYLLVIILGLKQTGIRITTSFKLSLKNNEHKNCLLFLLNDFGTKFNLSDAIMSAYYQRVLVILIDVDYDRIVYSKMTVEELIILLLSYNRNKSLT